EDAIDRHPVAEARKRALQLPDRAAAIPLHQHGLPLAGTGLRQARMAAIGERETQVIAVSGIVRAVVAPRESDPVALAQRILEPGFLDVAQHEAKLSLKPASRFRDQRIHI